MNALWSRKELMFAVKLLEALEVDAAASRELAFADAELESFVAAVPSVDMADACGGIAFSNLMIKRRATRSNEYTFSSRRKWETITIKNQRETTSEQRGQCRKTE